METRLDYFGTQISRIARRVEHVNHHWDEGRLKVIHRLLPERDFQTAQSRGGGQLVQKRQQAAYHWHLEEDWERMDQGRKGKYGDDQNV